MTNVELLEEKIRESGLKKQFIADALGISRFCLLNKLSGKSEFKTGEVKVLCDILHIKSLTEKEAIFFAS